MISDRVILSSNERQVLRDLAKRVGEIAANPLWAEKIRLWEDLNSLKKTRPLILCAPPIEAWMEIIPESDLVVENAFFRKYERDLRERIYRWEYLRDDFVITKDVYVPIEYKISDWIDGRIRPYSGRADQSARFHPCILEPGDLRKLRFPSIEVDWAQTALRHEQVQEVFGDVLNVLLGEPFYASTDSQVKGWGTSLMDVWCELRGLDNVLLDLYLQPDLVHEAMNFLMQGTLHYLSQMEKENLLRLNNNGYFFGSNSPLGSNGLAFTNELPRPGFDPDHVTTDHLWGYLQTQEFSEVSPEMLAEFVLPYQAPLAEKFGLNCYGCCESNDKKWDLIIEYMPNLRVLSVSHAASLRIAVEKLQDDYVLSWKPHPGDMIVTFDEELIRKTMKEAFTLTRGCSVVASLRDTQTLFGEPRRLTKWVDISMDIAEQF